MAKTVVLITQAASTCPTYAQRLHQFFGSSIALKTFSVEAGDFPRMPLTPICISLPLPLPTLLLRSPP